MIDKAFPVFVEPCSSDARIANRSLQGWNGWVGVRVKALATYFYNKSYSLGSSSNGPTRDITMPDRESSEIRTCEKAYRTNHGGRFLKRSLSPNEYHILPNGEPLVPLLVFKRLQNEAACMSFIRKYTEIPVPKLLETYEADGSYYLWMENVDGVEMSQLTEEQQCQVLPQGK